MRNARLRTRLKPHLGRKYTVSYHMIRCEIHMEETRNVIILKFYTFCVSDFSFRALRRQLQSETRRGGRAEKFEKQVRICSLQRLIFNVTEKSSQFN